MIHQELHLFNGLVTYRIWSRRWRLAKRWWMGELIQCRVKLSDRVQMAREEFWKTAYQ